jgi:hypothetical protein
VLIRGCGIFELDEDGRGERLLLLLTRGLPARISIAVHSRRADAGTARWVPAIIAANRRPEARHGAQRRVVPGYVLDGLRDLNLLRTRLGRPRGPGPPVSRVAWAERDADSERYGRDEDTAGHEGWPTTQGT